MKPLGKVFLSIIFVALSALQLFAQTPNNNSSVKIEIKNSKYVISGVVQSEAVKNKIIEKVSEISDNKVEFSRLEIDSTVEPFPAGWQKDFDRRLLRSKRWKSGVFIFRADSSVEYPNLLDDVLKADIFLTGSKKPVKLSDYRNKTVVLFFLASWCTPCRRQAERLNELYSRISSSDVEIIGVNVDADDEENFIKLAGMLNLKYKMGTADESFFKAAIKISEFNGIPQAFVIRERKLYGMFKTASPKVSKALEEKILEVSKMR
ncbi:MAG: TlpA family protein disulfide reductase [Acidobacteriota bacterium]|nr:TlpA family protein disulfide reductase [Acidobacteriota bacterium]